jgi:hypothetical protein
MALDFASCQKVGPKKVKRESKQLNKAKLNQSHDFSCFYNPHKFLRVRPLPPVLGGVFEGNWFQCTKEIQSSPNHPVTGGSPKTVQHFAPLAPRMVIIWGS